MSRHQILLVGWLIALGITTSVANAITVSGSYVASGGGGGTLTVKVTGASDPYDRLQIRCDAGDVPATFTLGGAAGWSAAPAIDFLVTKGTKTYCVFNRSSSTTSDQTVTIAHATGKRGGNGDISVGLGADPKSVTTMTGQNTLVSVGACDLPNTAACACDQSAETCAQAGGTYLGNNTTCPGNADCVPTVSQWGAGIMLLLVLTGGTIVGMRRPHVTGL